MSGNNSLENLRFRRQWYLGQQAPSENFHWKKHQLTDGFCLYVHADQLVAFDTANSISIAVIGLAFNPLSPEINIASRISSIVYDEKTFLNELVNLAGSYLIILYAKGLLKLFNDAGGLMGVYFDGTKSAASSSPTLLSPVRKGRVSGEDFKFEPGNDWYTGNNTAYINIKKLIPNCSLDLIAGEYERYWPTDSFTDPYQDYTDEKLVEMIASLLESMMAGVAMHGKVIASLTGGQDSRVVLAASKSIQSCQQFFTISGKGVDDRDVEIAVLLAKVAGVEHKVYQSVSTQEWLYSLYDEICAGEAIGVRREISGTCLEIGNVASPIHVNGNYGALCKSYYWHSKNPKSFKISSVIRDFISPGGTIIEGVNEWNETLPDLNAAQKYNLFYLEQRGGRWISAGENSSRLFYETFSPFNNRLLFTYICSLSQDLQYGGKLLKLLTQRMAPELSDISYAKARRNWSKYIPGNMKNKLRGLRNKLKIWGLP